jgi:hypothetical protein
MSKYTRSDSSIFGYLFATFLVLTLLVYGLRGFGILSFIPGGVILLLSAFSIITGTIYGIRKTQRF